MTDPGGLLSILAWMAGGLAIVWAIWRALRSKQTQETLDAAKAKQAEAIRVACEAGTHDSEGHPLCHGCGDPAHPSSRATEHAIRIVRSDGLWSWALQTLGAPARLRLSRDVFGDPQWCRECSHLAEAEASAFLLRFEAERRDAAIIAEVQLRQFERHSLRNIVRKRIDEHASQVATRGEVRRIGSGGGLV